MGRPHRLLAVSAAIGLALALAVPVFAYGPQVPHTIIVTPAKGTFRCDHTERVRATVLDQDGKPIKNIKVKWSFKSSPTHKDRILDTSTKTNKKGVTQTKVKLACKAGDRVIKAKAGGVSGTAVIHVKLRRHHHHHDDDRDDDDDDRGHDDRKSAVLGITSVPAAPASVTNSETPRAMANATLVVSEALPVTAPVAPIGLAILVATALLGRLAFRRRSAK